MNDNSLREIQEILINKLIITLSFFVIPAVLFSILRFIDIGLISMVFTDIFGVIFSISLAIFRKSFSYNIKIYSMIIVSFILGIDCALTFALSDFMLPYFMLSAVIAVIFLGKRQGIFISIISTFAIFLLGFLIVNDFIILSIDLNLYTKEYFSWISVAANFLLIIALVLVSTGEIGYLLSDKIKKLNEKNTELEKAHNEIKTLQGFLPICSSCKKIRDDDGYWNQIEDYITKRSDILFSHSLCETCSDDLYSGQEWYEKLKLKKISR